MPIEDTDFQAAVGASETDSSNSIESLLKKNDLGTYQPEKSHLQKEYVVMYYTQQYSRFAQIEQQRLNITNIIITLSVVGFTFGLGGNQNSNVTIASVLLLVILISNLYAIAYVNFSRDWMKLHRARAKRILELYANEIYQEDQELFKKSKRRITSSGNLQVLIHFLLSLAAFISLMVFILG